MNMRLLRHGALPLAVVLVAGLVSIALPTALEARGGAGVATAVVHAGGVDLLPSVRYGRAIVTVSGNGAVFRQVHRAGKALRIGVFDSRGQLLADGVYKWELQLVPDARSARRLRRQVQENGGGAAWRSLTGTFAVRNGLIADRARAEARPPARAPSAFRGAFPSTVGGASRARASAGDDDGAVGSRRGVEESVRAATGAPAAAGVSRRGLERADSAALATRQSMERQQPVATRAQAARRSAFDNNANGRPRSDGNQ